MGWIAAAVGVCVDLYDRGEVLRRFGPSDHRVFRTRIAADALLEGKVPLRGVLERSLCVRSNRVGGDRAIGNVVDRQRVGDVRQQCRNGQQDRPGIALERRG